MAETPLNEQELALFKTLLHRYLGTTCTHCGNAQIEDRHILTCTQCGIVLSDLRLIPSEAQAFITVR